MKPMRKEEWKRQKYNLRNQAKAPTFYQFEVGEIIHPWVYFHKGEKRGDSKILTVVSFSATKKK